MNGSKIDTEVTARAVGEALCAGTITALTWRTGMGSLDGLFTEQQWFTSLIKLNLSRNDQLESLPPGAKA